MLGAYQLLDNYHSVNLPQEVQTAFTEVTADLVGASYKPLLYVGYQLVNGTNHMIIAEQQLLDKNSTRHIVKMVINEGIINHKKSKIVSYDTII